MLPTSIQHGPAHERDRLRDAARSLEALVLKQLVTASGAFGGGTGAGSAIRADLFASTLADALVKGGGVGLAAQLERTLDRGVPAPPSPGAPTGTHLGALQPGSAPDRARALRRYASSPASPARGLKEIGRRADEPSGTGP